MKPRFWQGGRGGSPCARVCSPILHFAEGQLHCLGMPAFPHLTTLIKKQIKAIDESIASKLPCQLFTISPQTRTGMDSRRNINRNHGRYCRGFWQMCNVLFGYEWRATGDGLISNLQQLPKSAGIYVRATHNNTHPFALQPFPQWMTKGGSGRGARWFDS